MIQEITESIVNKVSSLLSFLYNVLDLDSLFQFIKHWPVVFLFLLLCILIFICCSRIIAGNYTQGLTVACSFTIGIIWFVLLASTGVKSLVIKQLQESYSADIFQRINQQKALILELKNKIDKIIDFLYDEQIPTPTLKDVPNL